MENITQDIRIQWEALGQDRYEIGIINQQTGKHMSDVRDWSSMERKISRYSSMNVDENIYIRALPDTRHTLLMLDDLDEAALDALEAPYTPACIVETSQGNFQCWFRLPRPFGRDERKAMERVLVAALASKGLQADKKSADGGHYGRLCGFVNLKPSRDGFRVRLVSASGHVLSEGNLEFLLEKAQELEITERDAKEAIVEASLHDIREHRYTNPQRLERDMVWIIESLRPTNSPSETDWYIACRLAKRGYTKEDIAKAILDYGPNDISRKHDASYYLNLTAANAIGKYGRKEGPLPPSSEGACCSCAGGPAAAGGGGGQDKSQAKRIRSRFGVKPRYAVA